MADEPRKPRIRARRVIERPRLIRALDRSQARVRTLVAGPGYGKTILTEQWAPRDDRVVGWFRARASAADVAVTARALAGACGAVVDGAGRRLLERLAVTQDPEREVMVLAEMLAEDLDEWPDRRLARRRRLPAPCRIGRVGAVRRDDRRALTGADPDREPRAPVVDRRPEHPRRRCPRDPGERARDERGGGRGGSRRRAHRACVRARRARGRVARGRRSRGHGPGRPGRRRRPAGDALRVLRRGDLPGPRSGCPNGARAARDDAVRRPRARRDADGRRARRARRRDGARARTSRRAGRPPRAPRARRGVPGQASSARRRRSRPRRPSRPRGRTTRRRRSRTRRSTWRTGSASRATSTACSSTRWTSS